ncbi:hypothetical protein [Nocardioides yefusunii]|uniref:BetI-type transcriptional repressor C-terminal domain-containing protein n=1 Tax=Nocardioides yefusunii TaxID=2500546 RepID=A0ABW1QX31_9ACTN|nr:hypothetical protein [Nocardioides yefusunii]
MTVTTDTEATRQSAHVLIDAVEAFWSGGDNAGVVAALEGLAAAGAVSCSTGPDGAVEVNVQPLLKASLTLATSLMTMIEVSDPDVDTEQVLDRVRNVVDLNAQL